MDCFGTYNMVKSGNSILRHEIGKWYLQNRGDDYKNERNSVIHFTNMYSIFLHDICFENNMFKKFTSRTYVTLRKAY
ncbi:hypothetical protein C0J52_05553 [Blattella germanica]|nr:hypothetical protein C0J52_05553 [Blattella germanica]